MSSNQPSEASAGHASYSVIVILLAAIVPYLNSLSGDFVFDDIAVIVNNPDVLGPRSSLWRTITAPYPLDSLYYRPVTMFTYFLNARLSAAPFGFHLVNIALHSIVSLLVFRLGLRIFDSAIIAFGAALLFAVHPIHTEAVTNIVGRSEVLAALFTLLCVLCSVRAIRFTESGGGSAALTATFLLLGLLAKESAIVAPAIVAAIWLGTGRGATSRLRRVLIGHAVAVAVFFVIRTVLFGAALPTSRMFLSNPLAYSTVGTRIMTAVVIAWDSFGQLLLPVNLIADYSFNQIPLILDPLDSRLLIAAAGWILILLILAYIARRNNEIAIASGILFLPLAITSNILFPIGTIRGERLLYLPSIGWCLVAVWILSQLRHQRCARWLFVALVLVFGARTWVRNEEWRTNYDLWSATVRQAPNNARVRHNLGNALAERERLNEALDHYRAALRIYPEFALAAEGVALIHQKRNELNEAREWYARALRIDSSSYPSLYHLSILHYEAGEPLAAFAFAYAAHEADPRQSGALVAMAAAAEKNGRTERAEKLLDLAERAAIQTPNPSNSIRQLRAQISLRAQEASDSPETLDSSAETHFNGSP